MINKDIISKEIARDEKTNSDRSGGKKPFEDIKVEETLVDSAEALK